MTALSTAELAARWHMHPVTIRVHARTSQIPGAMRIGARWKFPLDAVEAFEKRHTILDPLSMTDRSAARSR